MNLLALVDMLLSGLTAGYVSWLSLRGTAPWGFGEGFLPTLLTVGVFSSTLMGLQSALPSLTAESQPRKAANLFPSSAALGLAIPMTAVVLFALFIGLLHLSDRMPFVVWRSLWWTVLALALALTRGLIQGGVKPVFVGTAGFTPGLLFGGLLLDLFFLPRGQWLMGSLILGGSAGLSYGVIRELLKEAWLEELGPASLPPQFLLDGEEFTAGSDEQCDLTFEDGPSHVFTILERDGAHFLEVADEQPILVSGRRFRYRALVEGDAIEAADRVFIYHTRYARTRDSMPEAAL